MSLSKFLQQLSNSLSKKERFVDVVFNTKQNQFNSFLASQVKFVSQPWYYTLADRALMYLPTRIMNQLPDDGLSKYTDLIKIVRDTRSGSYYIALTTKGMLIDLDYLLDEDTKQANLLYTIVQTIRKQYLDVDRKLQKSDRKELAKLRESLADQLYKHQQAYIAPSSPLYLSFARKVVSSVTEPDHEYNFKRELGQLKLAVKGDNFIVYSHERPVSLTDL